MSRDIEKLCEWGDAQSIKTARGVRWCRNAIPTERFWAAWKRNQLGLRAAGVTCTKTPLGTWQVAWWSTPRGEDEHRMTDKQATAAAVDSTPVAVPPGRTLLPYQIEGVRGILRVWTRGVGCLLADEMGLGKTIQALAAINSVAGIKRVLIVCPKSLILNWQREIEAWITDKSTEFWVINYDRVAGNDELRVAAWDLLILDEAHAIKNSSAQRTKAIVGSKGIKATRRLYLTGTPVLNRPVELWPLIHSLDKESWGDWLTYIRTYCAARRVRIGARAWWETSGASNLGQINAELRRTVMVRRLKADVLADLPEKRRQLIVLDDPAAKQMDLRLRSALATDEMGYESAVRGLTPGSAAFSEMAEISKELSLLKVPHVIDHVSELIDAGEKVILFGHHLEAINHYRSCFFGRSVIVTGEVSAADRQAAVDRFQKDETCRVFIGGLRAASMGLTLTEATVIVMAEMDWTPGIMQQAEDRAHRIGLKHPVLIHYLVFNGTLDAARAQTIVRKQDIITETLDK